MPGMFKKPQNLEAIRKLRAIGKIKKPTKELKGSKKLSEKLKENELVFEELPYSIRKILREKPELKRYFTEILINTNLKLNERLDLILKIIENSKENGVEGIIENSKKIADFFKKIGAETATQFYKDLISKDRIAKMLFKNLDKLIIFFNKFKPNARILLLRELFKKAKISWERTRFDSLENTLNSLDKILEILSLFPNNHFLIAKEIIQSEIQFGHSYKEYLELIDFSKEPFAVYKPKLERSGYNDYDYQSAKFTELLREIPPENREEVFRELLKRYENTKNRFIGDEIFPGKIIFLLQMLKSYPVNQRIIAFRKIMKGLKDIDFTPKNYRDNETSILLIFDRFAGRLTAEPPLFKDVNNHRKACEMLFDYLIESYNLYLERDPRKNDPNKIEKIKYELITDTVSRIGEFENILQRKYLDRRTQGFTKPEPEMLEELRQMINSELEELKRTN